MPEGLPRKEKQQNARERRDSAPKREIAKTALEKLEQEADAAAEQKHTKPENRENPIEKKEFVRISALQEYSAATVGLFGAAFFGLTKFAWNKAVQFDRHFFQGYKIGKNIDRVIKGYIK